MCKSSNNGNKVPRLFRKLKCYVNRRFEQMNLSKWDIRGMQTQPVNECDCGTDQQTMDHLLCCPLLEQKCTSDDLASYNENANKCVQLLLKHI